MRDSPRRWLQQELPTWIEAGWISADNADRLRARYAAGAGSGRRWAVILFSILGAALVGLGVIMVLGTNWDQLSRGARAALAFLPLAAAQALAGWVLLTGRRGAAWREGAGTLLLLAVGASLALIAQTYNLGGTWQSFMLVWMLLSLPAVYLLQASFPAMLYLAGITAWLAGAWEDSPRLWYWLLLAGAGPFLAWQARRNPDAPGTVFPLWVLTLCLPVALGFSLQGALGALWMPAYAGLCALLFLAGATWFQAAPAAWQRPFFTAGAAGVALLAFLWTFDGVQRDILRQTWLADGALRRPDTAFAAALAAAAILGAVLLLARAIRRRRWPTVLYGALPIATLGVYALVLHEGRLLWLLTNGYFLALALAPLVAGLRAGRLGWVNAGMLLLAALILARFFDAEFSLLAKGLVFIGAGLAFLVINLALLRRKGAAR